MSNGDLNEPLSFPPRMDCADRVSDRFAGMADMGGGGKIVRRLAVCKSGWVVLRLLRANEFLDGVLKSRGNFVGNHLIQLALK